MSKQNNGDSLQIEQTREGWRVSGAGQVGVVIAGLVGGTPLILIVVSLFFGLADHPWALVALSAPVIIGQIAALTFVLVRMLDQRHEREMAMRDQHSARRGGRSAPKTKPAAEARRGQARGQR